MGTTQVQGFSQLQVTCNKIPTNTLISAITKVTKCSASSCSDGKLNGDEVGTDCGGSCRVWLGCRIVAQRGHSGVA